MAALQELEQAFRDYTTQAAERWKDYSGRNDSESQMLITQVRKIVDKGEMLPSNTYLGFINGISATANIVAKASEGEKLLVDMLGAYASHRFIQSRSANWFLGYDSLFNSYTCPDFV